MKMRYVSLLALLMFPSMVSASYLPAITINSIGGLNNNGPWTLGYSFSVNTSISVSALGYFDYLRNGFAENHTMGIWTSSGTLLASTSVSSGSGNSLIGDFRYSSLSSALTLNSGTYIVAGTTGTIDLYSYLNGVTVNPLITFGQDVFLFGSGLNFPTQSSGTSNSYFGPNMLIQEVPVPAGIQLAGIGIAVLGSSIWARRRKTSAVS